MPFRILLILITLIPITATMGFCAEDNCLNCHADKSLGTSVHAAADKGCKTCHIGVDPADIPHKFSGNVKGLPSSNEDLCYSCHRKSEYLSNNGTHVPVEQGMCTSCHDPHSSGNKSLLISTNVCLACHNGTGFEGSNSAHAPLVEGMCLSCHMPHNSRNSNLLRSKAPSLCYSCHKKEIFAGTYVHTPIVIGMCLACHVSHQSENMHLLKDSGATLCFDCHESSSILKKDPHRSVDKSSCLGCHAPHISENRNLIR
jgi:predicted CXXCH cytochrome family protein